MTFAKQILIKQKNFITSEDFRSCTASENDQLPSTDEAAQFWLHVDANAVQLLDQLKNLAVLFHDYLYKPPKEDHARLMADRSYDLQGLDKWINEQVCIGQLHVARRNMACPTCWSSAGST